MYNKFYYLHIPKTGGRYIKSKILPQLLNHIEVVSMVDHSGWINEIDDNTYIMTIIRDPIKTICSLYTHMVISRIGILNDDEDLKKGINSYKKIKNLYLDKNFFINWLTENNVYHNLQSKHFLPIFPSISDNAAPVEKNIDLILKRLDRINLKFDHDSVIGEGIYKITNKIYEDLNIYIDIENDSSYKYYNVGSSLLYNSLTDEEKKYISKYFDIDYIIYNKILGR